MQLDGEVEPDLSIAQWMVDNQVCQEYEELITRDGKWSAIFNTLLSGERITGATVVDDFRNLLHKSRWQLVIPDHLNMKSNPAQEVLINQAHGDSGHAELHKTYVKLCNKYHWQITYTNTKEFVEFCEVCQLTKSSTQEPVGLLTPLNVPTTSCIEIAMDFQF